MATIRNRPSDRPRRRKLRVSLSPALDAQIGLKAKAAGMTENEWMQTILAAAARATPKPAPLTRRRWVPTPAPLDVLIAEAAKTSGMTESRWMRGVLAAAVASPNLLLHAPAPRGRKAPSLLPHYLNRFCYHLKKIGTNVNQLAHQANTGMVPVKRGELEYVFNSLQLLQAKAMSVLEGEGSR